MTASNAKAGGVFEPERLQEAVYQGGTESSTTVVREWKQRGENNLAFSQDRKSPMSTDSDGYSDFFSDASTVAPDLYHPSTTVVPDIEETPSTLVENLSLKEAMDFYKISAKTIRLRIREGKIPAKKEEGPRGPEWRIYPNGLPTDEPEILPATVEECFLEDADDCDQGGNKVENDSTTVEPEWHHGGTTVNDNIPSDMTRMVMPSFAPELKTLMDVITRQAEKLEAASMRIGYLEARTENYESQIKLLTDSQHKRGWWARFGAWFLGQK